MPPNFLRFKRKYSCKLFSHHLGAFIRDSCLPVVDVSLKHHHEVGKAVKSHSRLQTQGVIGI